MAGLIRRDAGVGVGRQFHIFFIIVIGCDCKRFGDVRLLSTLQKMSIWTLSFGVKRVFLLLRNLPHVGTLPLVSIRNERFLVLSIIYLMSEVSFNLLRFHLFEIIGEK